ncbi:MAG: hypothetical protein EOO70_10200 [Myxococcaceae bacterium]|nr:MAG: hypothetical protein EOO70_10200 [Myxococcaceae bacterium]
MDTPEAPVLFRASMGRPQAWWDRLFLGLVSTGAALFYAGFRRLGQPLEREETSSGRLLWDCAKPVSKVRHYPQVYVSFESGRVSAVVVELKTFWGVDEEILYPRTPDRGIDMPDHDDFLPSDGLERVGSFLAHPAGTDAGRRRGRRRALHSSRSKSTESASSSS